MPDLGPVSGRQCQGGEQQRGGWKLTAFLMLLLYCAGPAASWKSCIAVSMIFSLAMWMSVGASGGKTLMGVALCQPGWSYPTESKYLVKDATLFPRDSDTFNMRGVFTSSVPFVFCILLGCINGDWATSSLDVRGICLLVYCSGLAGLQVCTNLTMGWV